MKQAALVLVNRQPVHQTSLISTPTHANANAQRTTATALCQRPISNQELVIADVMNTHALLTCLTSIKLAASAHAFRLKFLSMSTSLTSTLKLALTSANTLKLIARCPRLTSIMVLAHALATLPEFLAHRTLPTSTRLPALAPVLQLLAPRTTPSTKATVPASALVNNAQQTHPTLMSQAAHALATNLCIHAQATYLTSTRRPAAVSVFHSRKPVLMTSRSSAPTLVNAGASREIVQLKNPTKTWQLALASAIRADTFVTLKLLTLMPTLAHAIATRKDQLNAWIPSLTGMQIHALASAMLLSVQRNAHRPHRSSTRNCADVSATMRRSARLPLQT